MTDAQTSVEMFDKYRTSVAGVENASGFVCPARGDAHESYRYGSVTDCPRTD